jgi:hypothetical protein
LILGTIPPAVGRDEHASLPVDHDLGLWGVPHMRRQTRTTGAGRGFRVVRYS